MFRLDNLIEEWATKYKPLSHSMAAEATAKDKSFWRIDTLNESNEFVARSTVAKSPCVAVSTLVDAQVCRTNRSMVEYDHTIYVLIKQTSASTTKSRTDELQAAQLKADADDIIQDLLAWLGEKKRTMKALSGLELDKAEWATIPVKYNNWWVCGLAIPVIVPRRTCVLAERYND